MLQSRYLTESDLADVGLKSLGTNVRISSDCRLYGAENISIGSNVRIDDFTILAAATGPIVIGNYVFIARGCHLSGTFGITMEDFSSMAANTVIYSASDDYSGETLTAQVVPREFTAYSGGPVVIGRHVIIGSACVVIGPAHLGEGCSLGAMTGVFARDLEPWGVYLGMPARRLKARKRDLLELEARLYEQYGRPSRFTHPTSADMGPLEKPGPADLR